MSSNATNQIDTLSDTDVDLVAGGIRGINSLGAQIAIMQLNGVLDPLWEIVGQTGHLPTPEEHL
jgi:hypothetical protein